MIEAKTQLSEFSLTCECSCMASIAKGENLVLIHDSRDPYPYIIHPDCSSAFLKRLEVSE